MNAVRAMAAIVEALEGPYAKAIAKRRHPLLGSPTINVGLIQGGMQPNIVPDHCVIEIDRRTLPGETGPGVRREMLRFLKDRGLKVSLTLKGVPAPPLETDPALPAVREFMASVGRQRALGVHYFCDAAILAMVNAVRGFRARGHRAGAHGARMDFRSRPWSAGRRCCGVTSNPCRERQ